MELTNPHPPQDNEFEALKNGLTSFNESHTGNVFRVKLTSKINE